MLIVIVIIGILAWALIPRIGNARDKANDVAMEANVTAITSAAMQAIIDGKTPCSDTGLINYGAMNTYWMSDLWSDFHCRKVAGDHVVVWTTGMKVQDNNNCLLTGASKAINLLTGGSQIQDLFDVTGQTGTVANGYCYCMAQ